MLRNEYCQGEVLIFLKNCIAAKMNNGILAVTPAAGKTELLRFLTQFIPVEEKVMTIEDNLEIHYKNINPGSNCVELKVDNEFDYTSAIKAALRQNPQWVLLSEARSVEVKYLLECFSTGLHGLTTLHTDDTRKIPDRIENMMQDAYAASRLENDIYSFINIGVLLRKKVIDGRVHRFIDQVCFFDRVRNKNIKALAVEGGQLVSIELPENIRKKFAYADIEDPFVN